MSHPEPPTIPATSRSQSRQDLDRIFREGVSWSVMVGIGETYLAAFALAIGAPEAGAGLVSSLPLLAGGVLQLLTPLGVRRLGSRRRWVVRCAAVQTGTFFPLILFAILGTVPWIALFGVAAIYWGAGMAAGPAWNPWVGTLVPPPVRASFFARRTQAAHVGTALGLLAGGALLETWRSFGHPLLGFAIIFAVAAIFRAVSTRLLYLHREPVPPLEERIVGAREVLGRLRHREDGRLLLFLVLMTTSVALSGPFFTPFMLRQLDLSYVAYMGLVGTAYVAKVVTLSRVGQVGRRVSPRRLLRTGAAMVIPVPVLWLLDDSYAYLMVLQAMSGVAWSIYELGALLMFFEAIEERERTSLLTGYNLVNTAATAIGASMGAWVLSASPAGSSGYHLIFALSSGARLITGLLLLKLGHGRMVRLAMSLRAISVRPSSGGAFRPILSLLPTRGSRRRPRRPSR